MSDIRRTLTVFTTPERAFTVFTERLGAWWPPEYSWSQDVLDRLELQPRERGRLIERSTLGNEFDWGLVLAWEPPTRVAFAWMISPERVPEPNPARASEVEVRFAPAGAGRTRVELVHRAFERHGEGGEGYRAAMNEPEGWDHILGRYAAAAR